MIRALLLSLALVAGCSDDEAEPVPDLAYEGTLGTAIPLELDHHVLLVRAHLNGGPERLLIVDTGAQLIVLANDLPEVPAGGRLQELAIGDLRFYGVGAARLGLEGIREATRPEVAGLLGLSLLRHFAVTIDYEAPSMTLYETSDEALAALPADSSTTPIELRSGFVVTEAVLEGTEHEMIVDTGASTSVLFQSAFDRIGAMPRMLEGAVGRDPLGNSFSLDLVRLCETRVGGESFLGAMYGVMPDSAFEAIHAQFPDVSGLLGTSVLREREVVFDYPARELHFAPYPSPAPRRSETVMPGFALDQREGRVVIALVIPGSDAQSQGLLEGDEVLEIDGVDPSPLTRIELEAAIAGDEGETITLRTRRGGDEREVMVQIEELLPIEC